mmetsp:Transcript_14296/g.30621  ORF Transcript_14296/g.30621 Transcript_14296/m.30621 type:complete len:162 (+) Transcript_14296:276-761(+)|eukprot:CAMPEP_0118925928 /NCGR_PEP_ID=MMETSP1169-20130426/3726_1 /TAXON_ID=36882 /ORGANISM="Pyramimonas obovata, Strain CCMP722" /LENGTH=161 /DNA_ID=CAMNT_0006867361 /DNA_START=248 /DNA_END=733 /DNA_ORIENTATION=-
MSVLTPEKITEIRVHFGTFDTKGNGSISHDDIDIVLRAIGTTVTAEDLQVARRAVQEEADKANDFVGQPQSSNEITFNDFLKIWQRLQNEDDALEEQLRIAFSVFDYEGKQEVSVEYFKQCMAKATDPLPPEGLEELIREVDIDGDGQIDFWELKKALLRS